MPTQNRRVATYLPPELDDRLKAFIAERNLKGESQALITVLSEFFDVSYPVAHQADYSMFVLQDQFKELLDKVSELSVAVESKSDETILSKLREKLDLLERRIDDRVSDKSQSEAKVEVVPGQMSLLEAVRSEPSKKAVSELPKDVNSELLSDLKSEPKSTQSSSSIGESLGELQPLTGRALAERFGLYKDSVAGSKRSRTQEQFLQWSKEKDPDGIAWQYDSGDKLYYPFAETLSQDKPLPKGLKRSGED